MNSEEKILSVFGNADCRLNGSSSAKAATKNGGIIAFKDGL